MTDTRKYIEEQFDQFFEFDTDDRSTVTSASCRFFAEHCIEQLLAVIVKKDEALKYYADGEHIRHLSNGECKFEYGDIAQIALAINPEDVELEEVGEADFDKPAGTVNLDIYNIDFDGMHKLYTIKTKGGNDANFG